MKARTFVYLTVALVTGVTISSCEEEEDEPVITASFQSGQFQESSCADADGMASTTPNPPATNIFFSNETDETLKIQWINFAGGLTEYDGAFIAGETRNQPTYLEHHWYITTADDECVTVLTALRAGQTDTVVFRK